MAPAEEREGGFQEVPLVEEEEAQRMLYLVQTATTEVCMGAEAQCSTKVHGTTLMSVPQGWETCTQWQ